MGIEDHIVHFLWISSDNFSSFINYPFVWPGNLTSINGLLYSLVSASANGEARAEVLILQISSLGYLNVLVTSLNQKSVPDRKPSMQNSPVCVLLLSYPSSFQAQKEEWYPVLSGLGWLCYLFLFIFLPTSIHIFVNGLIVKFLRITQFAYAIMCFIAAP